MEFIIADLEWNGAYTAKAHGYFNEIMEFGAVKLNDCLEPIETFHTLVRPVVSDKLSSIVKGLTSITQEELEDGISFSQAVSLLKEWVGKDAVLLTWSTTDLLVLIENCRHFFGEEHIPFMTQYADLQAYCQWRTGVGMGQQIGLSKACQLLQIPEDGMDLHRALDDSRLAAGVLQKIYEPHSFADWVYPVNDAFYERITFKTTIISDIDSPLIKRSDLSFSCEECGKNLKRVGEWKFRNRAFCAEFICRTCDKKYIGRVQYKRKYEGVEVKRKLTAKPVKMSEESEKSPETPEIK